MSGRSPGPTSAPGVPKGLRADTLDVDGLELVLFEIPLDLQAPPTFTAAEREVLELLHAGRTSAEIARSRGTSARTVANQLASMYRKEGVNSRQELLAKLVRSGST